MEAKRSNEQYGQILKLLDVISIGVGQGRSETAALGNEMTTVLTAVRELRTDVTALRTDLTALRIDLTALRREVDTGFGRIDGRLGKIETRIEHLEKTQRPR